MALMLIQETLDILCMKRFAQIAYAMRVTFQAAGVLQMFAREIGYENFLNALNVRAAID